MRWSEAYEVQRATAQWWRSEEGIEHGERMNAQTAEWEEKGGESAAFCLAQTTMPLCGAEVLDLAAPVSISPDMRDLVAIACETFRPEPLLPSDPITPHGCLLIPQAWPARMIAWATMSALSTDLSATVRDYEGWRGDGILFQLYSADRWGRQVPTPSLSYIWGFEAPIPEEAKDHQLAAHSWIQTCWRLAQQRLTSVTRERPDRPARRRARAAAGDRGEAAPLRAQAERERGRGGVVKAVDRRRPLAGPVVSLD